MPALNVNFICFRKICLNNIHLGTVRGCGWQKIGAYVNLGSYYLVGIPIAVLFAFVFHTGGKVSFSLSVTCSYYSLVLQNFRRFIPISYWLCITKDFSYICRAFGWVSFVHSLCKWCLFLLSLHALIGSKK